MKNIVIKRHGSIPSMGTFGTLTVVEDGDLKYTCKTVEREWKDNVPWRSCIPAGVYDMKPHMHQGRYLCWQVQRVRDRWGINMHIANQASQLHGCIAVGRTWGFFNGEWAVAASGSAHAELMTILGDGPVSIEIIWDRPE